MSNWRNRDGWRRRALIRVYGAYAIVGLPFYFVIKCWRENGWEFKEVLAEAFHMLWRGKNPFDK